MTPARTGKSRSGALAASALLALALTAGAAPAPVPPPAEPVPAATSVAVTRFLEQWRRAWESQSPDDFLALHAADAKVDGRDRAAFDAHERKVFSRGEPVVVRIGDLEISEMNLNGERLLRAAFDQQYTSPSLSDFGRKEMLLRQGDGGLRIVRETWTRTKGAIREPLAGEEEAPPAEPPVTAQAPAGVPVPGGATTTPVPAAGSSGAPATATEPVAPLLGDGYVPPLTGPSPSSPGVDDILSMRPLLGPAPPAGAPIAGLPLDENGRHVVEEIVARINGQVLTRTMLEERIGWYRESLEAENPPDLEQKLEELPQQALDTTIDRWIIIQEAKSRQADFEGFWRDWLTQFRKQVGAADMKELEALLKEQGSTLARLKEQVLETEIPSVFLQREVGSRITFTDAEIQARFDAHVADYQKPVEVSFRQILVPVEEGGDPDKAQSIADLVIAELRKGRDWCELNDLYGAPSSPCGEVGHVAVSDVHPELRAALEGLPLKAVSKPIRSTIGVHVLQVTERQGAEPVKFDEVRDRVLADMRDEEYEKQVRDMVADLRRRAEIEINPRYKLPADKLPAGTPAAQPPGTGRKPSRKKDAAGKPGGVSQ